MSRKFKGFTPDQQYTLLSKMGYEGPAQQDDMDKFLASSPGAAARMGRYADIAQSRLNTDTVQMAEGGNVPKKSFDDRLEANPNKVYDNKTKELLKTQNRINTLQNKISSVEDPESERYKNLQSKIDKNVNKSQNLQQKASLAAAASNQQTKSVERSLLGDALSNPSEVIQKSEVSDVDNKKAGLINKNVGQLDKAHTVKGASGYQASLAEAAPQTDANLYEATKSTESVKDVADNVSAAQGSVNTEVEAAQGDPEAMAQLQLEAAQTEAVQVEAVNPRQLEPGEAVEGSAVDMEAVNAATQIEAAQANPSVQATVQGQLDELMQDFEGGETPTWAAGAMRAAQQQLAARGLGASSMAGQAVIQAAMESALPIAMADAQTYAQFDMANLNNRQQAVMLGAQQRAEFLGQKFDQEFQTKVLNAQKISDIANMNFTAEQQIALENARLAQSANLANLDAANAKVLSDAAAMSQMELTNLNNRQQAQVQNAQNFLQMDLANLSNEQQTNMFKAQSVVSALFSDQAADNAAKQFNAASQNQTDQFFADLQTTVSRFNAEQSNAAKKFNASEANAMKQFNATMKAERDRFNATNSLVVAQANAQWRQNTSMAEFEAQNQSNMQYAQDLNGLTSSQLDTLWQRERDIMAYAFQGSENAADRELSILMGDKEMALHQQTLDAEERAGWGALAAEALFGDNGISSWF